MALFGKKQDQSQLPTNGVPGVQPTPPAQEEDAAVLAALTMQPAAARQVIGEREIQKAITTLTDYKGGKANLESRVIEDERWYQLQHWEVIRRNQKQNPDEVRPEPTSAWLFNSLMNKHADAMDNYPEPNVLPRERGDEGDAKTLSSILPVIIERNGFEETYSDNWWEKLKHGTAAYGVFWNKDLENGLGDIDIRELDLLNIFWEPGIKDIQKSRNLFIVDVQDKDLLEQEYPQLKGKMGGNVIEVAKYVHDDNVNTDDKALVVDWYYKTRSPGGKTLLHYAKFVGTTLLFASENDPAYDGVGWYEHGQYPVVFDSLFPEKGTPVGFGYVAITKDPQLYIDKLGQNILETSMMATKPRFFAGGNTGVNEAEFLDWSKPIVHVEGSVEEEKLRQIVVAPLSAIYVNVLQMKIDELKETSANRDFSSGGTASGVTAASAIAALQEAGNKASRDMISAAYRAYTQVNYLCIELVRQFYDETRSFRITGEVPGSYQFVDYSNSNIMDQPLGPDSQGVPMFRKPVFDLTIKAQKKNPFSRMSQNELAKELYGMGFFNPERAQEALGALELMEFEGKDKVMEQVRQGQTLLNICQQMAAQMDQMAAMLQATTGMDMGVGAAQGGAGGPGAPRGGGSVKVPSGGLASDAAQAEKAAMTDYGTKLAARSKPNMNKQNGVTVG